MKDEIRSVGLKYQLATKFTSFVGVDHQRSGSLWQGGMLTRQVVDRPTQLIYIGISICQHTSTIDIAGAASSSIFLHLSLHTSSWSDCVRCQANYQPTVVDYFLEAGRHNLQAHLLELLELLLPLLEREILEACSEEHL